MKRIVALLLLSLLPSFFFAQGEGNSAYRLVPPQWNVFKFDPLHMGFGEIRFGYERKLNRFLSVEVDGGMTVSEMKYVFYPYNSFQFHDDVSRPGLGYLAAISARYYPFNRIQKEAMSGFYVAPKFDLSTYSLSGDYYTGDVESTSYYNHRFSRLLLHVGWQAWYTDLFCVDYYVGIGNDWIYTKTDQFIDHFIQGEWENVSESRTQRLSFNFGIRLGIGTRRF